MDYSTAIQPEGSSPWASSPQQTRHSLSHDEPPALSPALPQPVDANAHIQDAESQPGNSPQQDRVQSIDAPAPPSAGDTYHQPRPAQQRYRQQRPVSRQQRDEPQYKLQAKITGLERPGRKDLIVRFDVYTNLPGFRTTQFRDVRRTHAEFGKLSDHLLASTPEAMVPALPPSSTPAGVGTEEDEMRVKAYMQRWLNVVCSNRMLMRDDEIVRFVEGDPGYSPVIRKSQPATGARRKYLKQFAPPPDDTPELLEARPIVKQFYLSTMDAGQKTEKSVKAKKGMGLAESDLGAKLAAMTEDEHHSGLKTAYRKLGKTLQTIGDLHSVQATAEATTLEDPLNYHSADAYIVKETLTNRHILLRELLQAQTTTRSKVSATERLKSSTSVRRDKVDEAIAALDEARSHEQHLAEKTQRVTANLVHERRRWFDRTAADLRASVREYVVRQIEAERRALAIFESVRPDVRAIDASGGLSRLGREATPSARRPAMMSSQGPKGDAWSGVARRGDAMNRSMSGSLVGTGPSAGAAVANQAGDGDGDGDGAAEGRARAVSNASLVAESLAEDDDDRVDARNAASRLAQSTF